LALGTINQQSQDDVEVSRSLRFDVLLYSMCDLFMAITEKKRHAGCYIMKSEGLVYE